MWLLPLVVLTVSVLALLGSVRRARHEFEPTIRAFDEFRAALRPAIVDLRHAAAGTRARLDALDGYKAYDPPGEPRG